MEMSEKKNVVVRIQPLYQKIDVALITKGYTAVLNPKLFSIEFYVGMYFDFYQSHFCANLREISKLGHF